MLLKDELMELLLKIGETNLNQSDLFTEEKPSLFLPEGRTIYLEGDYYYIVGVERGKINSEKKFDNKEDILYYLLQLYVTRIASKNAWANANGDFERYGNLFEEEQIRLFSIIDPKYGERRRKEILENGIMNNLKEELTDSLSELIEFLSEYKEQHNVKYFIETLKNIIAIIENIENPELPIECIEQIRKMYKSMFFPRDGLSDFYIMDSDYAYMKRRNDQFSLWIKRIDNLLKVSVTDGGFHKVGN